jgi:Glycosyl hydrolase family 85
VHRRVLGTFITEWDAGYAACSKLLNDDQTAVVAAERLAAVAIDYGFDGEYPSNMHSSHRYPSQCNRHNVRMLMSGWLINIENKLDKETHVPRMLLFLSTLRRLLHDHDPGSSVIW